MIQIDPNSISAREFYGYLQSSIVPRPIAFASTIDHDQQVNLSPFSFFNVFGSNPPILIFSTALRARNLTQKDTFLNVQQQKEVVINIVTYDMVEQVSLASGEYDHTINEFEKAGFTQVASVKVKPPRVAESPVSYECVVKQIIQTGEQGGAGNLIICEVVLAHISERVLDENGHIDPFKLDAVGRMGGNYYCRANQQALFEVPRPGQQAGIGIDQLPVEIRHSKVLTGNQLARLASIPVYPDRQKLQQYIEDPAFRQSLTSETGKALLLEEQHRLAARYLDQHEVEKAWAVLLLA